MNQPSLTCTFVNLFRTHRYILLQLLACGCLKANNAGFSNIILRGLVVHSFSEFY